MTFNMRKKHSMIVAYVAECYKGPSKADRNLNNGPVHGMWLPVTCLAVHISNQQKVYWPENATAKEVQQCFDTSTTTSTVFS